MLDLHLGAVHARVRVVPYVPFLLPSKSDLVPRADRLLVLHYEVGFGDSAPISLRKFGAVMLHCSIRKSLKHFAEQRDMRGISQGGLALDALRDISKEIRYSE